VASLPTDNNGLIVQLPNVAAGGVPSLSGALVLGIGTQSNNSLSGVTSYTLDQNGNFITTFNGVAYNDASNNPATDGGSFIDTGSNGLFFTSPYNSSSGPYKGLLPSCPGTNSFFFCPPSITNLSATIVGASGSPVGTVQFQVGNFNSLINSSNNVFSDIGGNSVGDFDWGLPFFFGRNVYIGFESKSSLGTGQFFAY